MRRFARGTGRARARIAGSWQSGACYVQRAENSCACFFFFSSSLAPSQSRSSSPSHPFFQPRSFNTAAVAAAGSFRLLWPIVQKTDHGSVVSFSHLVAFIPRHSLHNAHLRRPAKRRDAAVGNRIAIRSELYLRVFFLCHFRSSSHVPALISAIFLVPPFRPV